MDPVIYASLNEQGQLVLQSDSNAPEGSVIRYAYPWEGPRVLVTKGEYLAPIDPLPGMEIIYRLFSGKKPISPLGSFVFEGEWSGDKPHTLIACTQNKDFMAYDWATRFSMTLETARQLHPNLILLGDSITHFWGGVPLDAPRLHYMEMATDVWKDVFDPYRAINMGFGNDRVENVLWRVRHGALDAAASDSTVLLLIGTNNMEHDSITDIVLGIEALCRTIMQKLPDSRLLLQKIYPRDKVAHLRKELNEALEHLDIPGVSLIDPGKVIEDTTTGLPLRGTTRDGIHPTHEGYVMIAREIRRFLP